MKKEKIIKSDEQRINDIYDKLTEIISYPSYKVSTDNQTYDEEKIDVNEFSAAARAGSARDPGAGDRRAVLSEPVEGGMADAYVSPNKNIKKLRDGLMPYQKEWLKSPSNQENKQSSWATIKTDNYQGKYIVMDSYAAPPLYSETNPCNEIDLEQVLIDEKKAKSFPDQVDINWASLDTWPIERERLSVYKQSPNVDFGSFNGYAISGRAIGVRGAAGIGGSISGHTGKLYADTRYEHPAASNSEVMTSIKKDDKVKTELGDGVVWKVEENIVCVQLNAEPDVIYEFDCSEIL